jgi:hypothetical protein
MIALMRGEAAPDPIRVDGGGRRAVAPRKIPQSAPQRLTIRIEREGKTEPWLITDIRAFDDAQPIRTMIQWAVDQLRVPASIDFWPNDAWYLPVGQKYSFVPCAPSLGVSDLSTIPANQAKKETC